MKALKKSQQSDKNHLGAPATKLEKIFPCRAHLTFGFSLSFFFSF